MKQVIRRLFGRKEEGVPGGNPPQPSGFRKRIMQHAYDTPFFLMDKRLVRKKYAEIKRSLALHWGLKNAIAYSFKTNYAVCENFILTSNDCLAEVVSGREYDLARRLGYGGKAIVFNGPLKREADLIRALKGGAIIHIDNMNELLRVCAIAKKTHGQFSVGIRIHGSIEGVADSRFGFSADHGDAMAAIQKIIQTKWLRLRSVHMHIGTDIDQVRVYEKGSAIAGSLCREAEAAMGYSIEIIDMGGGFPSFAAAPFHRDVWSPKPIDAYVQRITRALKKELYNTPEKMLLLEPGRFLIDEAVTFVTRVYDCRVTKGTQRVTTDGSISMLPLALYRPQLVQGLSRSFTALPPEYLDTKVYGSSCREDDVLYTGTLPKLSPGDFFVYYCVGAYNQSMGSDFIFGTPQTILLT